MKPSLQTRKYSKWILFVVSTENQSFCYVEFCLIVHFFCLVPINAGDSIYFLANLGVLSSRSCDNPIIVHWEKIVVCRDSRRPTSFGHNESKRSIDPVSGQPSHCYTWPRFRTDYAVVSLLPLLALSGWSARIIKHNGLYARQMRAKSIIEVSFGRWYHVIILIDKLACLR